MAEERGRVQVMRRVRMVMVPLVLVLVACFGFARPAYADWNDGGAWNVEDSDMGIKWGPTSVGGDRKGFVMVSDNRFNACLILCGISINDERLTADAKAKLSNSDTGGGFYLLAQRFGQYGSEGNLPEWAQPSGVVVPGVGVGIDNGSLTANSAIRTCAAMYGKDATWWGDYTDLELTNALRDLLAVLNGGDSGGSGGGSSSSDIPDYLDVTSNPFGVLGVFKSAKPTEFHSFNGWIGRFVLNSSLKSIISSYVSANKYVYLIPVFGFSLTSSNNYDYRHTSTILVSDNPLLISAVGKGTNNTLGRESYEVTFKNLGSTSVTVQRFYKFENSTAINYADKIYSNSGVFSTKKYTLSPNASAVLDVGRPSDNTLIYGGLYGRWQPEPTIPPTQWPDSPTYEPPAAPDVPEPTEPTIPSEPSAPTPVEPVQPDPSAPVQNPVFITQPTYVDNTYTADLQGILDALDEHCKHLQDALYANVSGLYSNLATKLTNDLTNLKSFLHGEFGWLNDARHDDAVTTWDYLQDLFSWLGGLISDNFYNLNQHLTQLFNWLAEQFDFSFTGTGYNDDTVVSWLKKIYSKLGTGMNTRPNDPVAEPDSFGDWLTRLLQNFIGDLLSVGQEAVGGLVNDFQQLATKFPFCVPWDIAALLALFVAEPVAPVFDLPAYTVTQNGLTQVSTYHISLADYNVAWEAVRFAEKIGFAVFLAWNTTHFREFLSGRGES